MSETPLSMPYPPVERHTRMASYVSDLLLDHRPLVVALTAAEATECIRQAIRIAASFAIAPGAIQLAHFTTVDRVVAFGVTTFVDRIILTPDAEIGLGGALAIRLISTDWEAKAHGCYHRRGT